MSESNPTDIAAADVESAQSAEVPQAANMPSTPVTPSPLALDGVYCALAALPDKALLTESALAQALAASPRSVRRMVARNDLPPPFTLAGKNTWFAGKVLEHLARRAEVAAQEQERYFAKFRQ